MTVPSNDIGPWTYLGDGASTTFGYLNKIFVAGDLKIFLDNVEQFGGFIVTGAGVATGGNVVFDAAPAALVEILILRQVANTQELDLVENDDQPAELIEQAFDRRTMVDQQQDERLGRAIVHPEGEFATGVTVPPIAVRALKFCSWDTAGNVVAAAGTSADLTPVSTFMNGLLAAVDAAAARALLVALENVVTTRGDLVRGSATGVAERLAKGAVNRFLAADANDVGWFGGTLAKTAAYTVVAADHGRLILVDATAGAVTITLPAAATAGDGFRVGVKKTDATVNAVTVDGDAAETIDGAATRVLSGQHDVETYECDGSAWHAVVETVPPGSLTLLSSATAANSAAVDFINLTTAFDHYILECINVRPATDIVEAWLRFSTDNGATFIASAGAYNRGVHAGNFISDVKIRLSNTGATSSLSNVADDFYNAIINIWRPAVNAKTTIDAIPTYIRNDGLQVDGLNTWGRRTVAEVNDAVRFQMSSGNIAEGEFHLYGVTK